MVSIATPDFVMRAFVMRIAFTGVSHDDRSTGNHIERPMPCRALRIFSCWRPMTSNRNPDGNVSARTRRSDAQ